MHIKPTYLKLRKTALALRGRNYNRGGHSHKEMPTPRLLEAGIAPGMKGLHPEETSGAKIIGERKI